MRKQYHRYHLCQTKSLAFYSLHYLALTLYLSAACLYASLCNHSGWYFNFRVYSVLSQVMYFLWRDVIREATFSWGSYKKSTTEAYVSALHFFIFSEVYVFFWFFWAFFHSKFITCNTNLEVFAAIWYYMRQALVGIALG